MSHPAPASARAAGVHDARSRPDASMSLLADIAANALDPGYALAAERRSALDRSAERPADRPAARHHSAGAAVVGVVLVGLLLALAARQATVRAPAATRTRMNLAAQVQSQSAQVASLQRQVDRLQATTAADRQAALSGTAAGAALAAVVRRQELVAGVIGVTGPGLRVTLDDAPASTRTNRVLDRDLQALVNALWAAGADAIAVDGERLTAQSAIRQAGDAVLVDFKPVMPPYVIDAVGDPVRLETSFATSAAAARMRNLAQLYGLHFAYDRMQHLRLRAGGVDVLHFARSLNGTGR